MLMLCLIDLTAVVAAVLGTFVAYKMDEDDKKKFSFEEEF